MKFLIYTILLSTTLFSNNIILTQEEEDFIKNKTFKISITTNWEPFSFKEKSDEPMGISYEYWKLIVEKLNLKTQNIFFTNFNKQLFSIKQKESDIIFSAGETSQRKDYALFSNKYLTFPISIVTKKDENFIENIDEIIDRKIAVGNNFTAHNLLKEKYPNLSLTPVASVKEGLELVSKDKVFAFIDIKPVLNFNIAKYGFKDLKITGNSGLDYELKFMIRDDYEILIPILNKAINTIDESSVLDIVNRWNNVQFQTNFDYTIIWLLLAAIFLITFAFLYRNYILKNLNNKLKNLVNEKTKSLHEINKNLEILVEKKSRDLIEKENLLNHQAKMAAMGEMLENIAHQWRQPLSVISTMATSLKLKQEMKILEDKEFFQSLDIINNASQHLSNTIDDFRNFFSSEKEINKFLISNTIKKSILLLKSSIDKHNITIVEDIEDSELLSYESELMQVILNIISNSIDILKDKNIDSRYIYFKTKILNNNLIITISDSGGGIDKKILNRVFEPYFTTKHKSQGTGIGLYMSLQIVTKHLHGKLSVKNSSFLQNGVEYFGAEFSINIPISIDK
ncbi:MAG: transporter substrate-binding domain-containing protein [Aliarcobacter skirrowii]|uniref:ATP-binding protein n=1 Tax=Aliarcobacter skirrowii TaxID=28200 RepID=UPI0024324E19|nr:transporter substrate-binding domain-containing protein [Aliarcobacter skirrowii]MDD2507684.1 transporter substrate-binding domain-containing protein [Aliarcobacter skirrowii]MDD3496036.1 transporter substrate-binding domain-containing protein [Aliarcobacter skirrowii]